MTYGALPFNREPTKYVVNGERVAKLDKRLWSAAIDYGTPPVLFVIDRTDVFEGNFSYMHTDIFSITGLFVIAVLNSVVLQGLSGYSIGRWLTNSRLLRPIGRTGFIKPAWRIVPRFIPHLLVYLLVWPASNSVADTQGCYSASECHPYEWLWWPILIGLGLFCVAWGRHPLCQSPADLIGETVVLNRRVELIVAQGSGRDLR